MLSTKFQAIKQKIIVQRLCHVLQKNLNEPQNVNVNSGLTISYHVSEERKKLLLRKIN